MIKLTTPLNDKEIQRLYVGDQVLISGFILCGRDAVTPKVCELISSGEINDTNIALQGKVMFHTALRLLSTQGEIGDETAGLPLRESGGL